MSRNVQKLIGTILTICLVCAVANSASTLNQDQQQVAVENDDYIPSVHSAVQASDNFEWQLLTVLSSHSNRNTIISPISIKIILALLYEGAGGTTELELQNVLQYTNKTEVRNHYSRILDLLDDQRPVCENSQGLKTARAQRPQTVLQSYQPSKDYTLNLGTQIFLSNVVKPLQPYETKACNKYHTKIASTDFKKPEQAALSINNYVSQLTQGKISKLVEAGDLENTIMLMVNAVYFKGVWTRPFLKEKSHMGGFYLNPGQIVQVPYMSTTDLYFYTESATLDAKIIRIPYKGGKFSMIIILPHSKAGLNSFLERMTSSKLRDEIYKMEKRMVDLVLPRFVFDYEAKMASTLKAMGLTTMFNEKASLPGIVRGSEFKLQVSDVIQKAGIEVNEEGSTAYAASEIHLTNKFGESQLMFNATHPFLFYIEDQQAQTILFAGKVMNPLERSAASDPLPSRFDDGGVLSAQPSK